MVQSVLVVCIGNICRSPMAVGLLRTRLRHVRVESAGLGALVGHPADAIARELMRERDIVIDDHRARPLSAPLCAQSDVIFVMDAKQKQSVVDRYPTTRGKVFRLGEFIDQDIFDPYGGERSDFQACLTLIDRAIEDWVERLKIVA
ncbi:low molecular weight phosphotyrosine protein phosphatase [Paraburkholderia dipogonis]|uniref:protein-tyrosine-phosphatase n=1 Tax=Paraburkholderia dipogonis TaxID=1211383 RepID=A0A4Y8MT27_9BURK|nr:low molecular weight protein-tyrosine-phosphatase [Paraburkholderia dipogonis]TFE40611.1 low molecular weight phosphotyrosine protein phosphatase [Paraburkholderia dipogonis]